MPMTIIGGSAIQVPVDLQSHALTSASPIPVSDIGMVGAEIVALDAVSIRDTTTNNSSYVDVSAYRGQKSIWLYNAHNQTATVNILAQAQNGLQFQLLVGKTVTSGNVAILTDTDIPALRGRIYKLRVQVSYTVAPTTGTFTAIIEGSNP